MGRLFLLLIVAVGLAPGTWVRTTDWGEPDLRQIFVVESLPFHRTALGSAVEVAGAWRLSSPNANFSGYSALLAMGDGTLLALSDHARSLRFSPPDAVRQQPVRIDYLNPFVNAEKRLLDLESATRDPATGRLWAAYELGNHIERYDRAFRQTGRVRPVEMRRWPSNDGPEAMVRLADGRFVVLSEGSPRWFAADLPGLLFPGDPLEGGKPRPFRFRGPEDFLPVDMAQLPDGRVLILLRAVRWGLPPRFESKLVVTDPAAIAPGQLWPWREVAHLAEPLPMDNYEGLAIEPADDGRLVLWLISDDNRVRFQRTLLLKLLWRPNEKARGSPRAPR